MIQPMRCLPSLVLANLLAFWSPAMAEDEVGYSSLLELFASLREVTNASGDGSVGVPQVDPAAIAAERQALKAFQSRLKGIDSSDWPVSKQIDYHLVRAELNGIDFRHRVTRPWFRDPGMYSDVVLFLGERREYLLDEEGIEMLEAMLSEMPTFFSHARSNLADVDQIPADLATLAIRDLENGRATFVELISELGDARPTLAPIAERAAEASNDFLLWLVSNQERMTAAAGVGRENYDWLLRNVYLFPYSWDELRTLVQLEDNRVISFMNLERNRNRHLPELQPVQSQEEYKQSVQEAIDDLMNFCRDEEIWSMPDYLTPDGYFGSWHGFDRPWPEKHDYFFNFSHREPRMEEAHEMLGHHFDELRGRYNQHPIRKGWRPYKISTARTEGFAFALEELLMHAGYLDKRSPRAREIVYEQAAFRTVRALSDVYMHDNQWTLSDAMRYSVDNAPHGELLDNSPHLWFEMATTLRGVGHHMLMVVGKIQFMKLMRDSAQQQGDEFEMVAFMDDFFESGLIPIALIRWEMTGYTDEVSKLW